MADQKISDLPAVTNVIGSDEYVLARSGFSKKITAANLLAGSGSGLFTSYAYWREEQSSGTNGGTLTSGSWQTRVLNTEVFDPDGIGTLSGNQVTLAAGTYCMEAVAPTALSGSISTTIVTRVYNVTDAAIVALSAPTRMGSLAGQLDGGGWNYCKGRVTIAGSKVFEVQQQIGQTQATIGLGQAAGFGVTEVYAQLWVYMES